MCSSRTARRRASRRDRRQNAPSRSCCETYRRRVERVERLPWGELVVTPSLPQVWDANFAIVEPGTARPASSSRRWIAFRAKPASPTARSSFPDEVLADRLWPADLAARLGVRLPVPGDGAAACARPAGRPRYRRGRRQDRTTGRKGGRAMIEIEGHGSDPEVVEQLLELDRRLARTMDVRHLAAVVDGSSSRLRGPLPRRRNRPDRGRRHAAVRTANRGLARAVVLEGVERGPSRGCRAGLPRRRRGRLAEGSVQAARIRPDRRRARVRPVESAPFLRVMRRGPTVLLVLLVLLAAWFAGGAHAASRMWVGFTDDPKLRFDEDRTTQLDLVQTSHATVVRTLVQWWTTAPTRPVDPTDPFDPAYRFDDLDELVRNAQSRGLEVEMAVWGTPAWANGDQVPQYAPDDAKDFQNFMQALASRYSGRYAGYPFVRFYGIWNESNLATFLRPQFDEAGLIVGPSVYARLAIAGVRGVKAGNEQALVAIGETSSNGRNKHVAGLTDTVAPGTFLDLVAKGGATSALRCVGGPPVPVSGQSGAHAEGALAERRDDVAPGARSSARPPFPQGDSDLDHRVRERDEAGRAEGRHRGSAGVVSPSGGAIARKDPRVEMFIWFVFRDSPGSTWQSGLYRFDGTPKPAAGGWSSAVARVDMRNAAVTVPAGNVRPDRDRLRPGVLLQQPGRRGRRDDDARLHGRQARPRDAGAIVARGRLHRPCAAPRDRWRRRRRTSRRSTSTLPRGTPPSESSPSSAASGSVRGRVRVSRAGGSPGTGDALVALGGMNPSSDQRGAGA